LAVVVYVVIYSPINYTCLMPNGANQMLTMKRNTWTLQKKIKRNIVIH